MNPIFGFNKGLDYSYLYGLGSFKLTNTHSSIKFPDLMRQRGDFSGTLLPSYFDKKKVIEGIRPSEFPKAKYKNLSNVKSFSKALETTASTLTGLDYSEKKAALKSLKGFVTAYNNLIESSNDTENTSILRREVFLTGRTMTYASFLEKAGLHIEKNNTLSLDEVEFEKAEIKDLEELFAGRLDFAGRISKQARAIAGLAENKMNSINKTYNRNGKYYPFEYATRIYEAV